MTNEEFNRIVDRYMSGQATESERKLIEAFFEAQERKQRDPDPDISGAMWQNIEASLEAPAVNRHRWRNLFIIASSLIVVCLLGYVGYHEYAGNMRELITKTAPFGRKSMMTLSDGSKVFLNAGSSISFPRTFDNSIREVTLEGEAFFEVTPNPQQPFVVRTGEVVTRVLGTSFNVMAFDDNDISITVATGRVQVFQYLERTGFLSEPSEYIVLDPSQQATYQDHRFLVSKVDVKKSIAWRDNTLRFDETPMSVVAATLERWYDVKIAFDNADIVNCRINGKFKDQRLEEVLKSIRYMYNIEYEIRNPNQIILYGKGCKN